MIYFIQEGKDGPIKIGYVRSSSLDAVMRRLFLFQTGNSRRLRLRAVVPGGRFREENLHQIFSRSRIRGEWFDPTPELLAFMDDLSSRTFTKAVLNKPGWRPPANPLVRKMFDQGLIEWEGVRKDQS